jgi:putative ABC transport system ATP-binding protein
MLSFIQRTRNNTMSDKIQTVKINQLSRFYDVAGEKVRALDGVSLSIAPGEFIGLIGRSGSGKTTLLNLVAGLDRSSEGDISDKSEDQLALFRRQEIGIIFQSSALLPLLTAYENIELPLRIAKISREERETRSYEVLDLVGMGHRAKHRPYELSGGEQQRIAIARAIVANPSVILADEPTGELDSVTAQRIFKLFRKLTDDRNISIIAATHDRGIIDTVDRVIELRDGKILLS